MTVSNSENRKGTIKKNDFDYFAYPQNQEDILQEEYLAAWRKNHIRHQKHKCDRRSESEEQGEKEKAGEE